MEERMQFWAKVMVAVGILFGFGGIIRLVDGSPKFELAETLGMLLASAVLIAFGIYRLKSNKQNSGGTPTQNPVESNSQGNGIPTWAILAMLVAGAGSSASGQGAVGFLIAFLILGLIFWLIEKGIYAMWRKVKSK
jgi:high-affinity Fe2+/Pb2+ permease